MAQVIHTYDAVPTSTTINDNACTSVTINVPDTFNVGNAHVAIGVDVTHTYRGDLRLEVDPPEAGEANKIFLDRITGDANENFRIMVSTNDDTTASSNDGSNDGRTACSLSPPSAVHQHGWWRWPIQRHQHQSPVNGKLGHLGLRCSEQRRGHVQ
ncbi:MAG: hypothetical protein IPP28_02445 [Xanthomonadales bacterium]|nr:hypothetical protein [Xanthomonadales bacterium]